MKIALMTNQKLQYDIVYTPKVLEKLATYGELSERITKKNLAANKEFLKDCEVAFSTWGMLKLTEEEIKEYLPSLKVLFYSAGTVQYFAKPFLNCGVKVFSAFAANAVPVAEFTAAQIMLATKGYFQSAKRYKRLTLLSLKGAHSCPGNFESKIGLVGFGAIGRSVAEKLMDTDLEVYAYDPFISQEVADKYNVKLESLEYIFANCDVISNHLANKKELNNIFNAKLFKLMKKHTTFINTGRGAQVDEHALARTLLAHPSMTAVIDVLKLEFLPYVNPLYFCPNAIITPHIAGSTGSEPQRMAHYMMGELDAYLAGEPTKYEVTDAMLATMA